MASEDDEKKIVLQSGPRWSDFGEAGLAAVLNLVPVAGGMLGSLVSSYSGIRAAQRVRDQISDVESRLTGQIRNLSPATDDQVVRLIAEAGKTTQREKLDRLRNAAVNLLTTDADEVYSAALAECVAIVETYEVSLLRIFQEVEKRPRPDGGFVNANSLATEAKLPLGVVTTALRRLVRLGLIIDMSGSVWGAPPPLSLLAPSELGIRFLTLISEPSPPTGG